MVGCGWVRVDLLVVGAEAHVVYVEEKDVAAIGVCGDRQVLGDRGVGSRRVWEERSGLGKIILTRVSGLASRTAREASHISTFAVVVGGRTGLGHGIRVGVFVIYSGQGVRMMRGVASRTEIGAHPNRRVGWAGSRHDDIATLTNTESDHVSSIRFDGHKIVSDDCHIEAIDGETLNAFGAAVDQSQSVLLAGLELEFRKTGVRSALLSFVCELSAVEAHLAVDQIGVRERGKRVGGRGHDFLNDLFVWLVVPVAEHDRSNVNVIRCLRGTVNDHRSCETGRVLSAVVRVIP